jgi:UDP-N-acetylmuramoylalanine--D-glutamate ligase
MPNDLKVVVGLGKTGLSCIRYFVSKGIPVAVTDSRIQPPGLEAFKDAFPGIPVSLGKFDQQLLTQASEIIISPGVAIRELEIPKQVKSQIPIVGDIELFAKAANKPIVAITGSNGKSTVTSLVGHLANQAGLRVKVGGNLGVAALDLLDDFNTDIYVLEVSSFQLETTFSLKPLASVNLNISPDHMDRYSCLEEYIKAKLRIYQDCKHPIINLDDPQSYESFNFTNQVVGFTLQEPAEGMYGLRQVSGENYLALGRENIYSTKNLSLKGYHQYANVLAALALGAAIQLPLNTMLAALSSFKGLPHRCQWIAKINNIDWYNDSKATNVGSTIAAIKGLGSEINGKLVLLSGGLGKNADFSKLYAPVAKYVRTLVLYGKDKQHIAASLKGAAVVLIATDLLEAVSIAKESAIKGDAVVLSPACASFDMFRDFEHRGEVFMNLVHKMIS